MKDQYIKLDKNQRKIINRFFDQDITISNIKDSLGKIVGQNLEFPESYSNLLNSALDLIIRYCEKQGLFITSEEIKDLLKKWFIKNEKNQIKTQKFIEELESFFKDELTVIIPNNILFLCEDVGNFYFGDAIKCVHTSQIKEEIKQIYANKEWWSNSILELLPSTNYSFSVQIKQRSTKKYADILAYKNLNIALSLLKIFSSYINTFYEKPYDVNINDLTLNCSGWSLYNERDLEHNALLPRRFGQFCGMIYYRDGIMPVSDDLSSYRILPDTTAELEKLGFNKICNDIFFSNKPIFQEIRRALDFMTKARIERDYNMKFVFLISSIESFVPNKKEEKDVTKKIKQLVAAIIKFSNKRNTEEVIGRFNDLRCDIIHSNKNYVSTTEYKLLKDMSEDICFFYIQKSNSHDSIESVFQEITGTKTNLENALASL